MVFFGLDVWENTCKHECVSVPIKLFIFNYIWNIETLVYAEMGCLAKFDQLLKYIFT